VAPLMNLYNAGQSANALGLRLPAPSRRAHHPNILEPIVIDQILP
jgi:hypothetical protein